MRTTLKLASVLSLVLVAGAITPAHAFDIEYTYPTQVTTEARTAGAGTNINHGGWSAAEERPAAKIISNVVLFANGTDKLNAAAKAEVKKVAALLKSPAFCCKHTVMINGYTDNVGKAENNQRLSYHRALSVMHALVAEGIPAASLSAQGFGATSPVADNATAEGRAANRRVSFTVVCHQGEPEAMGAKHEMHGKGHMKKHKKN